MKVNAKKKTQEFNENNQVKSSSLKLPLPDS